MKKITLTIASLFFALFLLVGCNEAPKPADAETIVIENATVTMDTVTVVVDTTAVEEIVE